MDSSDEEFMLMAGSAFMLIVAAAYRARKLKKKEKRSRAQVKPYLKQRDTKGRFKDVC